MKGPSRRALLLAAAPLLGARELVAQDAGWRPTRALRAIVAAAEGSLAGAAAHLMGDALRAQWGQDCRVEARPAMGGVPGATEAADALADGHTFLVGSLEPRTTAAWFFRNIPYRPAGLVGIGRILTAPSVLVVHPSVPAATVPELVAWLRKERAPPFYGSSGVGQASHLYGARLLQLVGAKGIHWPSADADAALADLIAGRRQILFADLKHCLEPHRASALRMLALSCSVRDPDAPTIAPLGETLNELRSFDVSNWVGAFLPSATPADVVAAYSTALETMLAGAEAGAALRRLGATPAWSSPRDFKRFVDAEHALWRGVIEREGVKTGAE